MLIQKKLITTEYNVDISTTPTNNFNVNKFNAAIVSRGYSVQHEKALKCPCINKATGSALPDCTNCGGVGWFYIERKTTKMLMQNLGNNKKYENWSETNMGTSTITSLFDDDVTYMDKIMNMDLLANFSQVLYPRVYNDTLFAFTIYEPIEIFAIYKFVNSKQSLVLLDPNIDYSFERNKVYLNLETVGYEEDLSLSIRYKHHPVYAIIDITREVFKAKQENCLADCDEGDIAMKGMPMRSVGRKFHYMFDAPNFTGETTQDNTDYTKFQ